MIVHDIHLVAGKAMRFYYMHSFPFESLRFLCSPFYALLTVNIRIG